MIQRKLPKKLTNPGSFIIPCVIGDSTQERALADSGANINVMPYKLFLKLGLEDMRPTRMTIQLADRSIKKPRNVVEDVLVRVDKLIIRVDFIILDVDDDVKEVLAINLLDEFLEGMDRDECKENNPPPTQECKPNEFYQSGQDTMRHLFECHP
ncbi:uncharacterized protein LOC120277731 [Dioscorea cayenensis subsp. rotundata]|uniref:Uncharacterized protein LOC120277731 n=1 Tax=Dioscorea cayennensis subsp. rotundata TaxID=55577 RepID=A0AB40CL20_DIOCR|nr:uncharacterized protein LOC120277731 [Dioscorea cayenensis subsp. rotundata]